MREPIRLALLHLQIIDGVGPVTIKRMHDTLGNDLPRVYEMSAHDISSRIGLPQKMSTTVATGLRDQTVLESERELMARHGIEWLCIADTTYPELLKHIHVPPAVLYYRGNSNILNHLNPVTMLFQNCMSITV